MRNFFALFCVLSIVAITAVIPTAISTVMAETSFADPEDAAIRFGSGNLEEGMHKSKSELCLECHARPDSAGNSAAGNSSGNSSTNLSSGKPGVGVPQLAGQYGGYLFKQLSNFKSGERKHPVMNTMVEQLSEEDLQNIATYFANQPVMQGKGIQTNAIAQSLFVRGDLKRNIMSCKSCHGVDGKGSHSANDINPVIAGQNQFYLREQLRNWRSAARTNSPSQVMNVIAKSLTDTEIEALAEYISDMP